MDPSSGLGRPGPGQPEFDRPSDGSWSANIPPARFGSLPASLPQPHDVPRPDPWGPPSLTPTGPPGGPGRRRAGVRATLTAGTLMVLVALGLLAWQLLPATPVVPPSTPSVSASAPPSAAPTVVRTPHQPRPTTSAVVTGGGIGQSIEYRTTDGLARVTVTTATWADNGLMAPEDGLSYLVVDLRFDAVAGTVTTGPFFTAVRDPGGGRHLITAGAKLESVLGMRTLHAGQDSTGQVAFEVRRGPVTFEVLDEQLAPLATVEIPG